MTTIKIKMDPSQKILLKRHLNKNGEAQVKFTQIVAKECNNYVPFDTGRLKDMMIELQPSKIIYYAPYAKKQYYGNQGNGKQGGSSGGLRGKLWDKRMWNTKGEGILQEISDFCGGRSR